MAANQAAVALRPEEGNTTGYFYHGARKGVKGKVAMDVGNDANLRDEGGKTEQTNAPRRTLRAIDFGRARRSSAASDILGRRRGGRDNG